MKKNILSYILVLILLALGVFTMLNLIKGDKGKGIPIFLDCDEMSEPIFYEEGVNCITIRGNFRCRARVFLSKNPKLFDEDYELDIAKVPDTDVEFKVCIKDLNPVKEDDKIYSVVVKCDEEPVGGRGCNFTIVGL